MSMLDVNQQLIAERLKISRATVSRCFTNHPGINPLTRAKVFKVAAEVGYAHLENRTSKTKKVPTKLNFGVLICSEEEGHVNKGYESPGEQLLAGVMECAHLSSANIEVHFVSPKDRSLNDESYAKIRKIRRRWKGLILIHPFPKSIIEELSLMMPVVSLVEQSSPNLDCVDSDHYKGISAAIDHLHAKGHRRIGFFTKKHPVESSCSLRRYAAFVEKMTRLQLPVIQEDVVNVFPSPEMDRDMANEHAANRTRDGVTAWVCTADLIAYDLIRGLSERGIRTPEDVSITGFGGIATSESFPELSTVQIPFREIGANGTQRLIERAKKRFGSPQRVFISCQFKQGKSVAAVGTGRQLQELA